MLQRHKINAQPEIFLIVRILGWLINCQAKTHLRAILSDKMSTFAYGYGVFEQKQK